MFSQGLFYLDWLLKNKKHFELLVKSKFGGEAKVSWEKPRVILIAQGFSRYIKAAVQTVGNVELKTYTLYEDNILNLESEYSPVSEKIYSDKKRVPQERKPAEYDLNYHLNLGQPAVTNPPPRLRPCV